FLFSGLAVAALAAGGGAIAAPADTCVFTVSMTSGSEVSNLDFAVNYSATGSEIDGAETHPTCARALGGALASFHDDDAGHLKVAVIRLAHFSAPVPLVAGQLSFDTTPPEPSDFFVTLTNAGRAGD